MLLFGGVATRHPFGSDLCRVQPSKVVMLRLFEMSEKSTRIRRLQPVPQRVAAVTHAGSPSYPQAVIRRRSLMSSV
jgi:hypothetical protein